MGLPANLKTSSCVSSSPPNSVGAKILSNVNRLSFPSLLCKRMHRHSLTNKRMEQQINCHEIFCKNTNVVTSQTFTKTSELLSLIRMHGFPPRVSSMLLWGLNRRTTRTLEAESSSASAIFHKNFERYINTKNILKISPSATKSGRSSG